MVIMHLSRIIKRHHTRFSVGWSFGQQYTSFIMGSSLTIFIYKTAKQFLRFIVYFSKRFNIAVEHVSGLKRMLMPKGKN